jgi:hypothetical protein
MDQAALQAAFANQQQMAQRNQALLAAGLQGLSAGYCLPAVSSHSACQDTAPRGYLPD